MAASLFTQRSTSSWNTICCPSSFCSPVTRHFWGAFYISAIQVKISFICTVMYFFSFFFFLQYVSYHLYIKCLWADFHGGGGGGGCGGVTAETTVQDGLSKCVNVNWKHFPAFFEMTEPSKPKHDLLLTPDQVGFELKSNRATSTAFSQHKTENWRKEKKCFKTFNMMCVNVYC